MLNSSQTDHTKNFMFDGCQISFKHVISAFYREVDRLAKGEIGKIPELNHDVVFKDAWNKMNVHNSKVLVKGYLTAEMLANAIQSEDWACVKTVEYLQVLERLFRDIFMSKVKRIYSLEDICFSEMDEALDWIYRWEE
eukprot:Pompholyxophrys_punicea_v1_NODE_128_length_3306_cov_6.696401.p2 type:complete len:138 gc:universal NODE_128_length_3306_cov_6.696401:2740-2327(-)